MASLLVRDAMLTHVQTVSEKKSIEALMALMQVGRHVGFPSLIRKANYQV